MTFNFQAMFEALGKPAIEELVKDLQYLYGCNKSIVEEFSDVETRSVSEHRGVVERYDKIQGNLRKAEQRFNEKYGKAHLSTDVRMCPSMHMVNESMFVTKKDGLGRPLPQSRWEYHTRKVISPSQFLSAYIRAVDYESFFEEVAWSIPDWDNVSNGYAEHIQREEDEKIVEFLRRQKKKEGSTVALLREDEFLVSVRRMGDVPWLWIPGFGNQFDEGRVSVDSIPLEVKIFTYYALKGGYHTSIEVRPKVRSPTKPF